MSAGTSISSCPAANLCLDQQAYQEDLELKNHELSEKYSDKARAFIHTNRLYQTLKQQVMASQVAVAAGDEAEQTTQTARGIRYIETMPGARTGTGVHSHPGFPGGHNRQSSGGLGNVGPQRGGPGLGPAPNYASHVQQRGLNGRVHTGRKSTLLNSFESSTSMTELVQILHPWERLVKIKAYPLSVEPVKAPSSMRTLVRHTKPRP